MSSNIDRLVSKVEDLQKLAWQAQNPSDVGAKLGHITANGDAVQLGTETVSCYYACDAPRTNNTPVWVQRTSDRNAVVIGVAF